MLNSHPHLRIPAAVAAILWAVLTVASCDSAGRRAAMLAVLDQTDSLNRNYILITTDSLIREAADYFDSHGTPNERLRAHYLLGCAYRDMGEAPRAINCFQDAISTVDTTNHDSDYRTLSAVYSQMAMHYNKMFLFINAEEAYKQSSRLSLMIKDTLYAAYDLEMAAGSLMLQNKMSEAESLLNEAMRLYDCCHATQNGLQCSVTLMYLYLITGNELEKVKHIIDNYEAQSDFFSGNKTLPGAKRQYYYYKGLYYEQMDLLDSAEYCYRQVFYNGMPAIVQVPMYKGLLSIYKKRNVTDSIAKYADLYCLANDSSLSTKDQEITAQSAASYNYNRYQRQSLENAKEAHAANLRFIIASAILMVIIVASVYFMRRNKKLKREQSAKYRAAIIERNKLRKEIESLAAKDYDTIIARKEREIAELNKAIEQQGTMHRQVMANDKLSVFEKSAIVQVFKDKRTYHKGQEPVSNDEWKALVSQFRGDMPSASSSMNSLSPLQLHVCILLLLGFEEGEIALVCQTRPQVITNAKARANQKLFLLNDSASLKGNLTNLIAS